MHPGPSQGPPGDPRWPKGADPREFDRPKWAKGGAKGSQNGLIFALYRQNDVQKRVAKQKSEKVAQKVWKCEPWIVVIYALA